MKQIWQCCTRSDWFYVLRKSQLTTQIGNRNAKDYDMGKENIHQLKESLNRSCKEIKYFILIFCSKDMSV